MKKLVKKSFKNTNTVNAYYNCLCADRFCGTGVMPRSQGVVLSSTYLSVK